MTINPYLYLILWLLLILAFVSICAYLANKWDL